MLQKSFGAVGECEPGRHHYNGTIPNSPPQLAREQELCLRVDLKLETPEIRLNKMPSSPHLKPFMLTLEVEWPYRNIWKGTCPTSQLYDFSVEFEGWRIWQWSHGKFFSQVQTGVVIPGGSPNTFPEMWIIRKRTIQCEGLYTIRGLFIASGQEIEKHVQIRIAH